MFRCCTKYICRIAWDDCLHLRSTVSTYLRSISVSTLESHNLEGAKESETKSPLLKAELVPNRMQIRLDLTHAVVTTFTISRLPRITATGYGLLAISLACTPSQYLQIATRHIGSAFGCRNVVQRPIFMMYVRGVNWKIIASRGKYGKRMASWEVRGRGS